MRWRLRRGPQPSRTSSGQVAAAEKEVELSRQRLHETREQVVKPLRAAAEHDNFAALIAASLVAGRNGDKR